MRVCRICGQAKPLAGFHRSADGWRTVCRECVNAARRKPTVPLPPCPPGMKRCRRCGKTKLLDAFAVDVTHADGHRAECRECHNRRRRKSTDRVPYGYFATMPEASNIPQRWITRRNAPTPVECAPGFKQCHKCGEAKRLEDFPRRSESSDGRSTRCKACNIAGNARLRAIPGWAHEHHLRRQFGITLAEYEALLARQGGVCAICGGPQGDTYRGRAREFTVDHDHTTGAVRGLLCGLCNRGLGNFRDTPALMLRAAEYVTNARADDAGQAS